jgi:hypothetical protein
VNVPTPEERRAIATLRRLAKRWPKTLWLFSANGSLNVMRYDADGKTAMTSAVGQYHPLTEAVDQAYSLATIDIPNDGGDW